MKKLTARSLCLTIPLTFIYFFSSAATPNNDACANATTLNIGTSCSTILDTLFNASDEGFYASSCGNPVNDVWYKFTIPANTASVSIDVAPSGGGSSFSSSNTYIEAFSGTDCNTLTLKGSCTAIGTTLTLTNLNSSPTTYYARVFTTTSTTSGNASKWDFTICVTYNILPSNDDCANATLITSDSTCLAGTSSLTGQTLASATADGGAITSSCTAVNAPDVWYKFVAKTTNPTITISNLGSNWGTSLKIQLLSGTCGAFTEVACANNNLTLTPSLTNPLTPGNTYYIRIYKNTATAPGASNWGFDICVTDALTKSSRMNEVFSRTILSGSNVLQYPWEVTYGPDNNLWITESRGYKVYKMDPSTGAKTTVLDLSSGSTWLPSPSDSLNAQSTSTWSGSIGWPQGGFAGLALHPKFLDGSGTADYVYVSYVHRYLSGSSPTGIFFRNKLVRFTYNTSTGKLESPVVLCDTLPGSSDHNSQRIIIAPVTPGGTNYLFYAQGDMGAGQFGNRDRTNKAQNPHSYEGKILRFNLVSDGDAGGDAWIPNDNPYSSSSAVYSIGIRNNQGFAYDTALNILYGTSHGPYSDDEINVIEPFRNYGHPLVIGYASDGNYNGTTTPSTSTSVSAGAPFTDNSGNSACPPIGDELSNKADIDASGNGLYKDPLFAAYASSNATIKSTWKNNPANSGWASEAWSGLDLYSNKLIPGWKHSLVAAGLKWGRMLRLKLGDSGNITLPSNDPINNQTDTITYFQSVNRYRDLAFAPNGKDLFLIMDNTSATSGPGSNNPVAPACPGCVLKYTFLGYADNGGLSNIPKSIDVTNGTVNTCNSGTTVTIDGSNNFLWVPITGPDGNIMAEINANGNNLGTVTSSFYKKASGSIRTAYGIHYLDRNITITPQTQPSSPVKVRLYISKTEFDDLDSDPTSGLTGTGNVNLLKIYKNSDPCGSTMSLTPTTLSPTNTSLTDLTQGSSGYVLQTTVSSFSSFYFGASAGSLPLELITFTGSLQKNNTTLLQWKTDNEINTSDFTIERSADGRTFAPIGTVVAKGGLNKAGPFYYDYIDETVLNQPSDILYYRLKISDNDGQFKYSNVVMIKLSNMNTQYLSVHPNPASNVLKIDLFAVEQNDATIQIININGQVALQKNVKLIKGRNQIPMNISMLANGTYYIHINGLNIQQKVNFQKM